MAVCGEGKRPGGGYVKEKTDALGKRAGAPTSYLI